MRAKSSWILLRGLSLFVICLALKVEARECARIDPRLSQVTLSHAQWQDSVETWETIGEGAQKQFQGDAVLLFNTLFVDATSPEVQAIEKKFGKKAVQKARMKGEFLRRLLLLIANGDVTYSLKDNDIENQCPWPFPLASILAHGQRLLIILEDMKADTLFNFLVKDKSIAYKRWAASHGVKVLKSGHVHEKKLGVFGALWGGLKGAHRGMDIPLGGLGNLTSVPGYIVGPEGVPLAKDSLKALKKTQHGHVYIRVDNRKKNSTMLIGIEPTRFGSQSIFKTKHTLKSSFEDSTKDRGVTGGNKWQSIKDVNVGRYGAMRLHLTQQQFNKAARMISEVLSWPEEKQQRLFQRLLTQNALKAYKCVENRQACLQGS